jgi:hypothetical protein
VFAQLKLDVWLLQTRVPAAARLHRQCFDKSLSST